MPTVKNKPEKPAQSPVGGFSRNRQDAECEFHVMHSESTSNLTLFAVSIPMQKKLRRR